MPYNLISSNLSDEKVYKHDGFSTDILDSISLNQSETVIMAIAWDDTGKNLFRATLAGTPGSKHFQFSGFSNSITDSYAAADPRGIAWDGTNILHASSAKIFKHDGFSVTITDSFTNAFSEFGITWDGSNAILGGAASNKIYIMSGFSNTISSSFASPASNLRYIGFGEGNLYTVQGGATDKLYQHDGVSSSLLDSIAAPSTAPDGIDWGLFEETFTLTGTMDAVLKATKTITGTTDAILKATKTVTGTTDAVLKSTFTKTGTFNAILKATKILTGTTDAILKATLTKTGTIDAVLKATKELTGTTDAVLKSTFTKTGTVDAVLKATLALTGTMDAVLVLRTTRKFTNLNKIYTNLKALEAETAELIKPSETTDSLGRVTAVTETADNFDAIFIELTEKDRQLVPRGIEIQGTITMIADPSYDLTNNGNDTVITVGDKIRRDDVYYRVETENSGRLEGKQLCIEYLLVRITSDEP